MVFETFEEAFQEILNEGTPAMTFLYGGMDISIYKYKKGHMIVDFSRKTIFPFDYKDLETVKFMLQQCNIRS